MRGTGSNSHENQGSGGEIGEHQDGTKHADFWFEGTAKLFSTRWNSNGNRKAIQLGDFYSDLTPNGFYTGSGGWYGYGADYIYATSRPTNTSVQYIIKY